VNALATLALLGVEQRALTLAEVRTLLIPVIDYIRRRELPSGELDALTDERSLAVVLEQLSLAKVVTVYRGGIEPVYSIESGAHLEAAFYRNSAVHWFVDRAIMELSVLAAIEPAEDHLRAGWQEAFRLRDLLKFEFFFPDRAEFSERITAEMVLVDPEWHNRGRETRGSGIVARLRGSGFMTAHRVLRAFFDAQLVVADRLADKDAAAPI